VIRPAPSDYARAFWTARAEKNFLRTEKNFKFLRAADELDFFFLLSKGM
jgi:hypothetical protein